MKAPRDPKPMTPSDASLDRPLVLANVSRRRFLQGVSALGGFVLAEGVDAASDLTFDVDVSIPPQAPPGRYRLAAQSVGGDLFFGPRIRIVD